MSDVNTVSALLSTMLPLAVLVGMCWIVTKALSSLHHKMSTSRDEAKRIVRIQRANQTEHEHRVEEAQAAREKAELEHKTAQLNYAAAEKQASAERSRAAAADFTEAVNKAIATGTKRPVKCLQCGAALGAGVRFCSFCGAPIEDNVIRAEITIEDKARIREIEQRQREREENGKLVNRAKELSKVVQETSSTTVENMKRKQEELRQSYLLKSEERQKAAVLRNEKQRIKLAQKQAKAEAKKAELKLREQRELRILLILFALSIVGFLIVWVVR